MDIKLFDRHQSISEYANIWLTPEECIYCKTSLTLLQSENKLNRMFFWGKINGLESDYYVAFGFKADCFRHRIFFYSSDALDWMRLPNPNTELMQKDYIFTKPFTGDIGKEVDVLLPPKFKIVGEKLSQELSTNPIKIMEEQRLACTVWKITNESAIVPRGAVVSSAEGTIILNSFFHGLKQEQAKLLSNYQYYREPQNKLQHNLLKRSDYNISIDFLDTLEDLVPVNKSIAIHFERNKEIVFLKSLHWLGMCCYHELESETFGFYYIGDGRKNLDILFSV